MPTRLTTRADSTFLLYSYFEKTSIAGTGKGSLWAMLLMWTKSVKGKQRFRADLANSTSSAAVWFLSLLWLAIYLALHVYTVTVCLLQTPIEMPCWIPECQGHDKNHTSDLPPPIRPPKPSQIAPSTWNQVVKNESKGEHSSFKPPKSADSCEWEIYRNLKIKRDTTVGWQKARLCKWRDKSTQN